MRCLEEDAEPEGGGRLGIGNEIERWRCGWREARAIARSNVMAFGTDAHCKDAPSGKVSVHVGGRSGGSTRNKLGEGCQKKQKPHLQVSVELDVFQAYGSAGESALMCINLTRESWRSVTERAQIGLLEDLYG